MNENIKFGFKLASIKNKRKCNSEGFNGYGKQRSNQYIIYGTWSKWQNKSGIYWIKNKITNKIYIGSSNNIGHRISKHFSQLRTNKHSNKKLIEDWLKYGQNSFDFGIFEFTDEDIFEKERYYQNKYKPEELYNLQVKGCFRSNAQQIACKNANRSIHKTPEYRAKMKRLKSNRIGKFEESTNKLLETFENSDEVCNKYHIAKSTLLGCCNGSKKRVLGYVWHYLDEDNNIMLNGIGRYREIIQNEDIV